MQGAAWGSAAVGLLLALIVELAADHLTDGLDATQSAALLGLFGVLLGVEWLHGRRNRRGGGRD